MLWVLFVFALILVPILVFVLTGGGFTFPWLSFYLKGKESGFSFREINLLRKAALAARLKNPASLFWSEKVLDRCIRSIIIQQKKKGLEERSENIEFLGKLFDFRGRVEFNLPKYRLGLTSSRAIKPGQILKIAVPGGVYQSRVLETTRRYLSISFPEGKKFDVPVKWRNQKVKVYFWRQDDAGYYFESKVLGDYIEKQFSVLHITHSENLVRTQKRASIRVGLSQPGYLYPIGQASDANEVWMDKGGYACRMVDISESGAGLLVGGRGRPGMTLKLQTLLHGDQVIMSGTVKSVNYNEKHHKSVLHLEALPPSPGMRNRILSYVYGILADPEEQEGQESGEGAHTGQEDGAGAQAGQEAQAEEDAAAKELVQDLAEELGDGDSVAERPGKGVAEGTRDMEAGENWDLPDPEGEGDPGADEGAEMDPEYK